MIVCSVCKKFVKDIRYKINLNGDIKDVTGVCKKHGCVEVDYDDYYEIVPDTAPNLTGG